MDDNRITYFALTDTRNKKVPFGIKAQDRTKHVYVIGKTGMGKSTLLENMAIQDIQNGEGLAFIDPHGGTAEKLLDYIPEDRVKDVLYFAPFDMEYPIAFNVMEDIGPDKRHLVVSGLMSAFKKIWVDAWSARMEYILQNTILALLEYPGATLMGINKMLSDKAYRAKVVEAVKDPATRSFWVDEFAKYTDKFAAEATPAIQNKVGQFTSNPLIRNIVGQVHSTFDIRQMMDERKILIINLSKGKVGESNANLLGSMLITKIYLAAMSRADVPAERLAKLPNFYLYVDEFQSFANESFADILSEARKYKLNLTIAHQYIEQMSEEVRAAVIGNVGTMIMFRVGAIDAELFEKEFAPQFTAEDIVNLGIRQIYLKLMIDGVSSQPFSATTMPPIPAGALSFRDTVIASSRMTYGRPRAAVEGNIADQTSGASAVPREAPKQNGYAPAPRDREAPRGREREEAPRPRAPRAFEEESKRENTESRKSLEGLRSALSAVVKEELPPLSASRPPAPLPPERPPIAPMPIEERPLPPRQRENLSPAVPPRAHEPRSAPPVPRRETPPPPSKPAPVPSAPRPPRPPEPRPMSNTPKAPIMMPPRGGKTANKELLAAALQEAMKRQAKPSENKPADKPLESKREPKAEERKPAYAPAAPTPPAKHRQEKREEPKPEPQPELRSETHPKRMEAEAPSTPKRVPAAPGEIPEDELKRLLET